MRTWDKQVATALFRAQSPITLVGQVVKTSPFHGEITGSTPVRVIGLQWSWIRILVAVDGRCYILINADVNDGYQIMKKYSLMSSQMG